MPDRSSLLTFVGRLKVQTLAQLVGTSVESLVAVVVGAPRVDARAATASAPAGPRAVPPRTTGEPPLAAMFGRASYGQIRAAVDRWLLTRVFEEERNNVSRAARRLHVSRRALRQRWARIRTLGANEWSASGGRHSEPAMPTPEPPSLSDVLTRGGRYSDIRNALDRWLIGGMLARAQGNVSQAARSLAMPRTQLRKRWARVRPK